MSSVVEFFLKKKKLNRDRRGKKRESQNFLIHWKRVGNCFSFFGVTATTTLLEFDKTSTRQKDFFFSFRPPSIMFPPHSHCCSVGRKKSIQDDETLDLGFRGTGTIYEVGF